MPSRVLVHLPPPEPPRLVDCPPRRPARGEEFPAGWTVADYQLERGEFAGEEYAFEVWVIPLLARGRRLGERRPRARRRLVPAASNNRFTVLSAAVPTLYGYQLTAEDGDRLVAALDDAGTHASLEAAAAIRWGEAMEVPVDDLEPELCRAILDVLDRATTDLEPLRATLSREMASAAMADAPPPPASTTRGGVRAAASTTAGASKALGTRRPLVRPAEAAIAPCRRAGSSTAMRSSRGAGQLGRTPDSRILGA